MNDKKEEGIQEPGRRLKNEAIKQLFPWARTNYGQPKFQLPPAFRPLFKLLSYLALSGHFSLDELMPLVERSYP